MKYSILAPIIFTVNVMNNTRSVENISQTIRNIDATANRNDIIGFNIVGMLNYLTFRNYCLICICDRCL